MSIDYSTYVGPYARCAAAQEPKTQLRIACLNPQCASHAQGQRTKFCSLCGSPVGTVPHTVLDDAVSEWDVRESIDERLCTPGGDAYYEWKRTEHAHLWKPNIGKIGRRLDGREAFNLDEIATEQPAREIAQFQEFFAADLETLRAAYGAGAVTLHWGVIQDYL